MSAPVIFISYSHDSNAHRERVLELAERLRADGLDARVDQYVKGTPSEGWPRWMLNQLDDAAFVLVVCTETYYLRFRGREVPGKGKGADWEGALITQEIYDSKSSTVKFVPVMLALEPEKSIPEPLRPHTRYVLTSEVRYQGLYEFLRGAAGVEARPLGPLKTLARKTVEPLTFGNTSEQRVATSRLTHTADRLFGRDKELSQLEVAWTDSKTHVVTLVAWGGVGKTSLVAKWAAGLAARNYDGADYYDWSFYSQGTREQGNASADTFIDAALRFFGDTAMADSTSSPWDKGARLAKLVADRRTLLVLDGLEPLQHPPGPLTGELKDPAITALLKGLAARNAGLCLVTTRERVANLAAFRDSTAPEWALEHLSTEAGVALLESLEVHGSAKELTRLVEDVEGHALTIDLLGRYLTRAHGGDVRRRDRVDLSRADLKIRGGHAFKTIAAYETWLASSGAHGQRQLAILRLLGLFDRPAEARCIAALRLGPAIAGLTEPLVEIDEDDWNAALSELKECRLLTEEGSALDSHPLIRERFAQQLRETHLAAWQAAHGRLFDHLKDTTEPWPDTLIGLQPLYQAVVHGCHAGRQQEACDAVYFDRITRGQVFFSTKELGAFGADLGAVACFFERPWTRISSSLTEADQGWLLNQAAHRLRALGRLTDAAEPMRSAMEMAVKQKDSRNGALYAANLSDVELMLGDISGALRDAELSVNFADQGDDVFRQATSRGARSDALHQAGRRDVALAHFREAEMLQAKGQPEYPLLYSLAGFRYCDLLLVGAERAVARGLDVRSRTEECRAVEQRAAQTLEWARQNALPVLTIALDHLTLGRARLYRAILERGSLDGARSELEQAVDGFRRAGAVEFIVRSLVPRAWQRFAMGDRDGAQADLDEAQEIAERGPMPLYLADINLYRARLFHDRAALAEARRLVEKHGYWRRREELEDAEAMGASW